MMTLIHKVDTLYEMIGQLNRKMALIASQCAYTKKHLGQQFDFDARISDYSLNGEILDSRREYLDFDSGKSLPNEHHHQNSASNGKILESTLKEFDVSSPMDLSASYLDDEDCYPSGEAMERSLIHQDILGNEDDLEEMVECDPPEITEDIQIRRLTAQLTAAYNRIAALEEQLLSKRIHV